MADTTDPVARARALVAAAQSGHWETFESKATNTIDVHTAIDRNTYVVHWVGFDSATGSFAKKLANARLIAAAPELLSTLADEVEALRKALRAMTAKVQHAANLAWNANELWEHKKDKQVGYELKVIGNYLENAAKVQRINPAIAAASGEGVGGG